MVMYLFVCKFLKGRKGWRRNGFIIWARREDLGVDKGRAKVILGLGK
jgi:hypothetical protein